jgi:hypothetical protein
VQSFGVETNERTPAPNKATKHWNVIKSWELDPESDGENLTETSQV